MNIEVVLGKLIESVKGMKIIVLLIIVSLIIVLYFNDKYWALFIIGSGFLLISAIPGIINIKVDNIGRIIVFSLGIFSLIFFIVNYSVDEENTKVDQHENIIEVRNNPPEIKELSMCKKSLAPSEISPTFIEDESKKNKHGNIGIVTGGLGSSYYKIGYDLKRAIERNIGINIDVYKTGGTLDNVNRVYSSDRKYNIGILQEDFYKWASSNEGKNSGKIPAELISGLNYLSPLYKEYLHVFVNKNSKIRSIRDLKGKYVNGGSYLSGSYFSTWNINAILSDYGLSFFIEDKDDHISSLCKLSLGFGGIDAVIYVGGTPVPLLENISLLNRQYGGIKLINSNIDEIRNDDFYSEVIIPSGTYNWLNRNVKTVATQALLFSYNFKKSKNAYNKNRCTQLVLISDFISGNVNSFKRGNYHPAWKNRVGEFFVAPGIDNLLTDCK